MRTIHNPGKDLNECSSNVKLLDLQSYNHQQPEG